MPSDFSGVCVCARALTCIIIRPVQMGKNSFLQTFCNSMKLDILLQFWNSWQDEIVLLFLEKKVHLTVKVAVEFISLSFFFWIWLHGQNYSWKLFHLYKYTMPTIRDTILLSHLIWEKASQVYFFFQNLLFPFFFIASS